MLEIPQPGDVEPNYKLAIPVIVLIKEIVALRYNPVIISKEYLEGM